MIGRNDLCPCGSGKKYKKCHGAAHDTIVASPAVTRARVLKARDVELGERLMPFARTHYGPHWLFDVLDSEDLLDDSGGIPDAEMPIVIPWLMHFRVDETASTLAEEWQRRQSRRVSDDDRILLEAYRAAWVSLWEVAEVVPGTGSRLIDVLTREERFVYDVRTSNTLQRFDTILAIVLTCDGVSFFGGVHAQPLPPRFVQSVTAAARRLCRVRTRAVAPGKLRDVDLQLDLLDLWREAVHDMINQPPPSMQNTDGDPFVLTRDDFELLAPRADVARQLASLPGVEEPEPQGGDTVFVVTKQGNPVHRSWSNTVTGRIVLAQTRLTAETNSTRRADALRSEIETRLQGLVKFRLRKEENTAQLVSTAWAQRAPRRPPADEELAPQAAAALRHFREQHMSNWLDEAIPALDGLTPRQAALLPRARPKLEVLLKEFEQSEAHLPEQKRIDLNWLRETLGISFK